MRCGLEALVLTLAHADVQAVQRAVPAAAALAQPRGGVEYGPAGVRVTPYLRSVSGGAREGARFHRTLRTDRRMVLVAARRRAALRFQAAGGQRHRRAARRPRHGPGRRGAGQSPRDGDEGRLDRKPGQGRHVRVSQLRFGHRIDVVIAGNDVAQFLRSHCGRHASMAVWSPRAKARERHRVRAWDRGAPAHCGPRRRAGCTATGVVGLTDFMPIARARIVRCVVGRGRLVDVGGHDAGVAGGRGSGLAGAASHSRAARSVCGSGRGRVDRLRDRVAATRGGRGDRGRTGCAQARLHGERADES